MEKDNVVYGSFDDLLANKEVEYATVTIDGKPFRIGSITGEEFVEWTEQRNSGNAEAKKEAAALLITRSLVDDKGTRIGDEKRAAQIRKLKLKISETFLKAIFKLNGINQPEEAAKNA